MRHADYEIYTFEHNGIKYWAFDIEYFGHYVAKSEKEILDKVAFAKAQVKQKLIEIDRLNKEYYANLAAKEKARAESLKAYRRYTKELTRDIELNEKKRHQEQIELIKEQLLAGKTAAQITKLFPDMPRRTIAQVFSHMIRKNLL